MGILSGGDGPTPSRSGHPADPNPVKGKTSSAAVLSRSSFPRRPAGRVAGGPVDASAPANGANVTDDKNFKHLVRDEARRTGRPYTEVRAELRPPPQEPHPVAAPMDPAEVADRFEAIVASIDSWILGKHEMVRLVATALIVPGNALFTDVPGNGMTALGQGAAAAIGGRLVSIDGRTGFDASAAAGWRPGDVVVVSHFDGLDVASQVAIIEASKTPAIVLAKRHPIADRMPHPPDDDTRERFIFGLQLGYANSETEIQILAGNAAIPSRAAVDAAGLARMRAATAAVNVPEDVRRFAVDAIAATRTDEALLIGGSTVTTFALVRAAAAIAVADGRAEPSIDDVRPLLRPVLAHRVVFRPDGHHDLDAVIERATNAALKGAKR